MTGGVNIAFFKVALRRKLVEHSAEEQYCFRFLKILTFFYTHYTAQDQLRETFRSVAARKYE